MSDTKAKIGIVGLGVMGLSLARNIRSRGYTVIGFDPNPESSKKAEAYDLEAADSLNSLVNELETPRRILIMVPAGNPVDAVIGDLSPLLTAGDSIVDGGNSHFKDTARREQELARQEIHYLGLGVSGGRRGALEGPGMMAGGSEVAFTLWQEVLEAIAARYEGEPCVAYLGPAGAGHYVKMVHNGIEYGMMQILAEAYAVLKIESKLGNNEIAQVYRDWDRGELRGFLTKITADIFQKKDASGEYWIDQIKDAASQKGTGNWTVQNSLELGVPIPAIDAAVRQRQISANHEERLQLKGMLKRDLPWGQIKPGVHTDLLGRAVHAAQLLVYVQGFHLLAKAKEAYNYSYSLPEVARIWRNGCIISSKIVEFLSTALPDSTSHPLLIREIWEAVLANFGRLRNMASLSQAQGLSLVCFSACSDYWCSFTNKDMPTNLIQAQRDFFGGHGLELRSGEHTSLDWEGTTNRKPDSD